MSEPASESAIEPTRSAGRAKRGRALSEPAQLTERFEAHRAHLKAVAYKMLGSMSEADDAVQETWLHLHRSDTSQIENLGGWLTTIVGRICLDMLRSRATRREQPLDVHLLDLTANHADGVEPESEALLTDTVGVAMLVVLDTLTPAERLAFVLHDLFAVPFDDIAAIVGRSASAARQLASRARRRVRDANLPSDTDLARQREVVDAFLAAAREGDFDALFAVLDPDVVARADAGIEHAWQIVRGRRGVAEQAMAFARRLARFARPALVNRAPGLLATSHGRPLSVLAFTISGGKITEIQISTDPERLAHLNLPT